MQRFYRRTPMWKYDFNKVAMQFSDNFLQEHLCETA